MSFIFNFENLSRKFLICYFLLRYIFITIFRGKLYEKQANGFKQLKKRNKLNILDIGANDGLSTSFFINAFNDSKIYIFEPLKFTKIKNKFSNKNRLKYFNIGLGDKGDVNFINIPYFKVPFLSRRFYLSAYSTVSKKNDKIYNLNTSLKTFFFYKKILCEKKKIKIKKLDKYNLKPDIIKLDVEGFEDKVILGSKNTIKINLPILYLERPTKKSINFFLKLGYFIYIFDNEKKKFNKISKILKNYRNYFFIHKKSKMII